MSISACTKICRKAPCFQQDRVKDGVSERTLPSFISVWVPVCMRTLRALCQWTCVLLFNSLSEFCHFQTQWMKVFSLSWSVGKLSGSVPRVQATRFYAQAPTELTGPASRCLPLSLGIFTLCKDITVTNRHKAWLMLSATRSSIVSPQSLAVFHRSLPRNKLCYTEARLFATKPGIMARDSYCWPAAT